MGSFPDLESVCFSMSRSKRCFLTCIQIFQKADQMVWDSHLFKNFPQFVVIHTVEGFNVVNEAAVDVFMEFFSFFCDPTDVAIWSLVPLLFLNPACRSGSSWFMYCWSLAWRILSIALLACEMSPCHDDRVEGLIFSCESTKFAISCWTTLYRRMLEPTKNWYLTSKDQEVTMRW